MTDSMPQRSTGGVWIAVVSQLKIPRKRGKVHWDDPHHPAHVRIVRFHVSGSSVLHEFQRAFHRSAGRSQLFPHAVEKEGQRVLNS